MTKLILLISLFFTFPLLSSEMFINIIKDGEIKCKYPVVFQYQGQTKTSLELTTFEDAFSARLTIHISNPIINNNCTNYSFVELIVNESMFTTNDIYMANKIKSLFNNTYNLTLNIDLKNIRDDKPRKYIQSTVSFTKDGNAQTRSRSYSKIDRFFVDFQDLDEYNNIMVFLEQ